MIVALEAHLELHRSQHAINKEDGKWSFLYIIPKSNMWRVCFGNNKEEVFRIRKILDISLTSFGKHHYILIFIGDKKKLRFIS